MTRAVVLCVPLAFAVTSAAQEYKSLQELMSDWGTDIANRDVTVQTFDPGLHVLKGAGGNVLVSIGEQGVLMVDSQFPQMIPKLKVTIRDLGGDQLTLFISARHTRAVMLQC